MPYLIFLISFTANGQGLILSFQVTQPTCIKSIGHNFIQSGDGSITVNNISNGMPPYSYTLISTAVGGIYGQTTFIQNNGYFPGLYDGHYTVVVTDAVGATAKIDTLLTSKYPWPVFYNSFSNPLDCNSPDGSIEFFMTKGTPPYLFSVDGGINYSTDDTIKNLAQGSYIPLVMDANGCISSYYNTPNQPFYLSPNNSQLDTSCNLIVTTYNSSVTSCHLEGSKNAFAIYIGKGIPYTSTGNNSYLQFSIDGVHYHVASRYGGGGGQSDEVTGLAPGNYTYYVKDTVTGLVSTLKFFVPRCCDVYIGYVFVLASCGASDGALTVQARNGDAPYTYSMDGVHFQTDSTFSGLSSGIYGISVKDAGGNITSSTATVYNKCPFVRATSTNEYCNQQNGTIQAHGFLGTKAYQFSLDNINYQNDSLFTKLPKSTYTVYIKDAKGFVDSIANIKVSGVCLNVTASVTNENCNHRDGGITATGSDGTPPYLFSIDGVDFKSNNIFSGLNASTYILSIKDANNLVDTIHVSVLNRIVTIGLGNDTTLCKGKTLFLLPNIPNATYIWQDGSTNSSYTVSKAGQYWATMNVGGCMASDTITVSYLDIGSIFTANDTTACIGNNILLDAKHSGSTFLWDDGSTKQARTVNANGSYWARVSAGGCSASDTITCRFVAPPIVALPTDTSFCNGRQLILNAGNINATYLWNNGTIGNTLVVTKAGMYTVAATANGCTGYDSIKVLVKRNPQVALGSDTTLCTGQILLLNATTTNATYLWQDGSVQPVYPVAKQGSYSVKVTANGCDTTGTIKVAYTTKPMVAIGNDTTLCNTDKLLLDATYPQSSYLWQDGSTNRSYTVSNAGTYIVDVTNYCGMVKDSVKIKYEDCACQFYVPSAFSPNGDGRNDVFKPSYKCLFSNYRLDVFGRLGNVVFTSTNAGNGWDGTVGGQQQPTGGYVWVISYFDTLTGKAVKTTGSVVLIK